MRWYLRTGALLCFPFLAALGLAQMPPSSAPAESLNGVRAVAPAPPPEVRPVSVVESAPPVPPALDATRQLESIPSVQLAADPFKYRAPESGDGFVPAPIEMPEGIQVMGILMLDGGPSLTALKLPGEDELYYVGEDDDVPIRAKSRTGAGPPAAGSRTGTGAEIGLYYLRIKQITSRHVEVFPEHSPGNIQILR